MATSASSSPIQRFGGFEVDPRLRELRRKGTRIRMQDQPLEILLMLLERRGEVVTREELKQRLWPPTTFVDADDGLNTAIRKLREILGDSAEHPVYIETIPRRGYRFIGTIEDQRNPSSLAEEPAIAAPSKDLPESRNPQVQFRWKVLLSLVAAAVLAVFGFLLLQKKDYFWRNPVARARFQSITDIEGIGQAAAISRDGHFVAFLSDRDGQTDVWVTQIGSGQFHNLTHGTEPDLGNPYLRILSFSPDGSLVTFWARKRGGSGPGDIGVWAVPTLGGEPRPYLEGVAEFDWSPDTTQLAYHTPGPGDPLFIANGTLGPDNRRIFTAPEGLHSHFPLWSADKASIYFVQGTLPDKLDIWRIPSTGGTPQRITSQNTRVSYPVLLGRRTLLYLASDPDGSGPWLYGMDVERRIPHKLASSLDHYTSLAVSADARSLVVTHGATKKTLWRLQIDDSRMQNSDAVQIPLTTASGFSPRLGPDYLLYISATGSRESIWKLASGASTELWSREGAHILGAPAIASDGQRIAVSVQQQKRSLLFVMQADGTNGRIVTDALDLQGAPAWSPDGKSIIVAANERGVPHLFRISIDGGSSSPTALVGDYSVDPTSEPNGRFVVYSGPDVGTTFAVKSVTPAATPYPLPPLNLTRGARHMAFVSGGQAIVFLRGEVQHKDIWTIDLKTRIERRLTSLPADFDIRDFDISPDGREIILERVQELSEVALLDLKRP